ncbi:MAG: class I SAM-dependent methyltransferase, partial [Gemmataceae bacterium]
NRAHLPGLEEHVGDSHAPDAAEFLRRLGRTFDLVGIDGDHSYEGVKADWELVEPHLAPGAVVWFHDTRACEGVARWWAELRPRHPVLLETDQFGIGVLRRGGAA